MQVGEVGLGAGLVPGPAGLQVHELGARLGEPVGQRGHDDRAVVVLLALVLADQVLRAVDGDGERAEVVARGGAR